MRAACPSRTACGAAREHACGRGERALPPSQAHLPRVQHSHITPARWKASEGSARSCQGFLKGRGSKRPNSSLLWRRATVGAGWGPPGASVGGLEGVGRSSPPRRRVLGVGRGWVAPQEAEPPPPSRAHVHAGAHARTVSCNYNYVTVRRPRVYIKLSMAISIVLDSGDSLGCSPPPRKGARGRVHRPPSVPSSAGTPKSRTNFRL